MRGSTGRQHSCRDDDGSTTGTARTPSPAACASQTAGCGFHAHARIAPSSAGAGHLASKHNPHPGVGAAHSLAAAATGRHTYQTRAGTLCPSRSSDSRASQDQVHESAAAAQRQAQRRRRPQTPLTFQKSRPPPATGDGGSSLPVPNRGRASPRCEVSSACDARVTCSCVLCCRVQRHCRHAVWARQLFAIAAPQAGTAPSRSLAVPAHVCVTVLQ
jgi:hypothetical protein